MILDKSAFSCDDQIAAPSCTVKVNGRISLDKKDQRDSQQEELDSWEAELFDTGSTTQNNKGGDFFFYSKWDLKPTALFKTQKWNSLDQAKFRGKLLINKPQMYRVGHSQSE